MPQCIFPHHRVLLLHVRHQTRAKLKGYSNPYISHFQEFKGILVFYSRAKKLPLRNPHALFFSLAHVLRASVGGQCKYPRFHNCDKQVIAYK